MPRRFRLGISQDMFGDLTTVSMSFAYGDNEVGQNGDDDFEEEAKVRSYRLAFRKSLPKTWSWRLPWKPLPTKDT